MSNLDIEEKRLALERERFEFKKKQANKKLEFLQKIMGVLIGAAVSFAAVIVSAAQVWVARINKQ